MPWAPDVQVVYEHLHRYLWAAQLVTDRRVLDLGSGEGFGSAILSEAASSVLGIDLDELTVQHSQLNYSARNLTYEVGSALELSSFEDGSFDAVVAFEVIEHVAEQELVLDEIARLLGDDGVVIVSTPDRPIYGASNEKPNPFHERELTISEFTDLLSERFSNVATWGQRTITGSHLSSLAGPAAGEGAPLQENDFYVERAGEEWRVAGDPAALYCVAVASKAPLPAIPDRSTLADYGLQLLRRWEGDAVRAAAARSEALDELGQARHQLHEAHEASVRAEHAVRERLREQVEPRDLALAMRTEDVNCLRGELEEARNEIAVVGAELAVSKKLNRLTEESVTWQMFQRLRGRVYGKLGEGSASARLLGMSLRFTGRLLFKRRPSTAESGGADRPQAAGEQMLTTDGPDASVMQRTLAFPVFERPKVSLVIPVYAHCELTRACLESIRFHTVDVSYEVIVVDDMADEDTKALLESVPGLQVVRNEQNLGYLRSMNRGAEFARGQWLVLFNNDTEVTEGWLSVMLDCGESAEDVGVVTPKFVYPDGSLNEAGGIVWRDGTGVNYGRGDSPEKFQYEYRRETDYGSAAALMVRADFWREAGGFDERFLPMYYEDTDICFQARAHNLRVMYEPSAVVVHVEGATAGSDPSTGFKRHQEQNRPKFVAKWSHELESEAFRSAPVNIRPAADRGRGRRVLVIDHHVPMWDHDSGSLRMFEVLRALIEIGARVTFMPDNLAPCDPYTRRLQSMGIEVMYGALNVDAELATIGPSLEMVILSRPHPAARWLDKVREYAPGATVVYDTVDLHWLREARRSAAGVERAPADAPAGTEIDLTALPPKAAALRELELAMMRACDATVVVSDAERLQVERDVPGVKLFTVPNIHRIAQYVLPPEDRLGILFVGSFRHPPNVGAALRLVRDVMPVVRRELQDVRLTIVGADPPPEVQALASPFVEVAGWVEDLHPLLEQSSVLVAPLNYGAGLKGKVTQCLAAGLPVVTTAVGAEGIEGLSDCVLVAEDAEDLAAQVVRVVRDAALWRELSQAGQALIERTCSPRISAEILAELLAQPASETEARATASASS